MNETIAHEKMEFLDQFKSPTTGDIFAILAHLSEDALCVEYGHEDDIYLAQYKDKSYIIARNVLGEKPGPDFESGVLSEEGWAKIQGIIADQQRPLSFLN